MKDHIVAVFDLPHDQVMAVAVGTLGGTEVRQQAADNQWSTVGMMCSGPKESANCCKRQGGRIQETVVVLAKSGSLAAAVGGPASCAD